ncbi:MAG: cell division protein FtsZ [Alphaproteobacteria bacterium]|nr:cell division protein FtsZ [Alphaproteobacteria bacterium]
MPESGLNIGLATPPPEVLLTPNIGVIGVGGAGGNAVNNMISSGLVGVSFFAANTDAQALSKSLVSEKIQLGVKTTQGLGAGAHPEVGKASAEESADKIKEAIQGLHLLFLTAGMGGGTGTGALPVIASYAKEMGIMTVAVVSTPFMFEGRKRMQTAMGGIDELKKYVDTMIIVPNQNLFRVAKPDTTFADAFKMADDVLCQGVRSITDLIMNPGIVNLDFADLKTVLKSMGRAMMGSGIASGENRATIAAEKALCNPLLDDTSIKGAKSVLINICAGMDLTLAEMDTINQRITAEVPPDANIIFGTTLNESLAGSIQVSVVATGLAEHPEAVVSVNAANRVNPPQTEVIPPEIPLNQGGAATAQQNNSPVSSEEEPVLIQMPDVAFAPVAAAPNVSESLVVETTEEPTIPQDTLLKDVPPSIGIGIDVDTAPTTVPPINMQPKTAEANVKPARTSLFDLVPGLSRSLRTPKARQEKPAPIKSVTAPAFPDTENGFDLPSFFKE